MGSPEGTRLRYKSLQIPLDNPEQAACHYAYRCWFRLGMGMVSTAPPSKCQGSLTAAAVPVPDQSRSGARTRNVRLIIVICEPSYGAQPRILFQLGGALNPHFMQQ